MITEKQIEDTIYQLYKEAAIVLGDDVKCSLEEALKREDSDLGKLNIEAILKNIELAEEKSIPMCQDTGLPIIFVKLEKQLQKFLLGQMWLILSQERTQAM